MRKTPRGWIQIGESRTRSVARIPLGLKPSRDSRATSQRDSPIWIQPWGVFRYIMWYKIFIVKFQMYTCDAGDGNFILYVNEYQHWTFPKHSHKRFVSLNALFPKVESQQPQLENDFLRQIFLPNFICVLYATTYVISSYLVQSRCEVRKLEYSVWARLVKRTDG